MEYHISIPYVYWSIGKNFKQYVLGYLKRVHPDMKPVRVHRYQYIICEKRGEIK